MKKYERYKDSGLEWLGNVPEHWKVMKMKYLCNVTDGTHFSPTTISEGKPYITVTNVKDDVIDVDGAGKISLDDFNELVKQGCQPKTGDVLLTKDGTVGRTAIVKDNDYVVLSSLGILSPNTSLTSSYLKYMLDSLTLQEQMNEAMAGSALRRITITKIKDLLGLLPPLTEQRIIAAYLDYKVGQIDALISEKEKMVDDLKAYRSSIITEAVTKGLDKNVEMKDSGNAIFKHIPHNWVLTPIKYLTDKVGSGVTPTGGANVYQQEGIIFLRSQNIYPTGLQLDDVVYISEEIDNNMSATRVNKGDVLLNITGASIGRCFTYNIDERANVNQHVCIIRPKQILLNGKYLQYIFNSNAGQNFISSVQNGANREGLNFEQIKNFSIPTPTIEEQERIVLFLREKLSKIDKSQTEIEHQLSDLKSYKSSLITEAVTGKIDLRDWQTQKA